MAPGISIVLGVAGNLFSKRIDATSYALAKFSVTLGVGLTTAITAPLAALAAPVVTATRAHNEAMRTIRVSTGAVGPQLNALVKPLDEVRLKTRASVPDASAAVSELTRRLGLTGADLSTASVALVWLGEAGGSDLQATAASAGRAMAAWGVSGGAVATAFGALEQAARVTSGGSVGLLDALARVAPVARAAGLSLEQSGAMLASLSMRGVPVEAAMAGLSRAMQTLVATSANPAAALRLHVESIRNATSASDAGRQAVALFGESGVMLSDAIRSGALSLEDLRRIAIPTSAPIETLAKAFSDLRIRTEQALKPLGETIQSTFWPLVKVGIASMNALADIGILAGRSFGGLPEWLQEVIVFVGTIAAVIGPVLVTIGKVVAAVFGLVAVAVKAVGLVGILAATLAAIGLGSLVTWLTSGQALSASLAQTGSAAAGSAGALPLVGVAITSSTATVVSASDAITAHAQGTLRSVGVTGQIDSTPPALPSIQFPDPKPIDSAPIVVPPVKLEPVFADWKAPGREGGDLSSSMSGWQRQVATQMSRTTVPGVAPLMPDLVVRPGESLRSAYIRHGEEMGRWYGEMGSLGLLPTTFASGAWWDLNRPERWFAEAERVGNIQDTRQETDRFWSSAWRAEQDLKLSQHAEENRFRSGFVDPRYSVPEEALSARQGGWQQDVVRTIGTSPMTPQVVTAGQIADAIQMALGVA